MSFTRKLRNNLVKPLPLHYQLFLKHVTGGVEGDKLTAKDFTKEQLGFLKDALLIKSRENTKFNELDTSTQQLLIKKQGGQEDNYPLPPSGYIHPVGGDSVSMYQYPHFMEKSFGHVQGKIGPKGGMTIRDRYQFDLLPGETKHAGSFDTSEGRSLGAGRILDWAKALGWVKPFDIDIGLSPEEVRSLPRNKMTPQLQIKKENRDDNIQTIKDPLRTKKYTQKRVEASMNDWVDPNQNKKDILK